MTDDERRLVQFEDDLEPTPGPRARFGTFVAVALGLVAVTVVLFSTRDPVGIESLSSSTTTTIPSLGTVATPTTVPEPGAPPVPTETKLGTLTWVEAEFDTPSLPQGDIQVDPLAGGYVIHSYDGRGLWRSPDGLRWRRDLSESPFGSPEYVFYSDEFAFAGEQIYEIRDGEWVELSMAVVPTPEVEGLHWDMYPGSPVSSGETSLIPVATLGGVPWGEIYGFSTFDCGMPEPCESTPWGEWSSSTSTFRVLKPESGTKLATVELARSRNRLVLTDVDTGTVIHRIIFPDANAAETFVEELDQGGSVPRSGSIIREGDNYDYEPLPWAGYTGVYATDSGFVAFENFDYPGGTLDEPPQIWRSEDGRDWEVTGSVDFLPDRYQYAQIQTVNGLLVARIVTDWNPARDEDGFEEWVSADGVDWRQRPSDLAPESWIQATDYGYMATGWVGFGPRFWVSADGESWEVVSLPVPRDTDSVWHGTAGDLIYYSSAGINGLGTMWIGRFVN